MKRVLTLPLTEDTVNAQRDPSADEASAELPREDKLTRGEKSVRDKACYLIVQPLWLLLHLPRFLLAGLVWLVWGRAVAHWAWRKIFTPANFLTTVRFLLLGKAIALFFSGAPLVEQVHWLFFAIITDFFDGPMARLNDEVTELGIYLDHSGDWSVMLWVTFMSMWYGVLPLPYLLVALAVIPTLFSINLAKFVKFYDGEVSPGENIAAFATEELQTDIWGRIQFFSLVVALFGGLFLAVLGEEAFLFGPLLRSMAPEVAHGIVHTSLALAVFLGGYNTQEALDYSELKAKKFREKLRKFKGGPS